MEIQLFIYKKHIKYPMKYTIKETRFFDLKKVSQIRKDYLIYKVYYWCQVNGEQERRLKMRMLITTT